MAPRREVSIHSDDDVPQRHITHPQLSSELRKIELTAVTHSPSLTQVTMLNKKLESVPEPDHSEGSLKSGDPEISLAAMVVDRYNSIPRTEWAALSQALEEDDVDPRRSDEMILDLITKWEPRYIAMCEKIPDPKSRRAMTPSEAA